MPPRAATTYEEQSCMKSTQSAVISSDLFGGALDETTREALNTSAQNCTCWCECGFFCRPVDLV
jgi:hypothetical protein